jgi:hypothetical protein
MLDLEVWLNCVLTEHAQHYNIKNTKSPIINRINGLTDKHFVVFYCPCYFYVHATATLSELLYKYVLKSVCVMLLITLFFFNSVLVTKCPYLHSKALSKKIIWQKINFLILLKTFRIRLLPRGYQVALKWKGIRISIDKSPYTCFASI